MKKNVLIFSMALASLVSGVTPSPAGTITVTVVTAVPPCDKGACTKTYTDTDANLAKIVVAYGPYCQSSNLVGTPPVPTACSSLQTLAFWFNSLIQGTVGNVTSYYQQQAVQALPAITPINPQ